MAAYISAIPLVFYLIFLYFKRSFVPIWAPKAYVWTLVIIFVFIGGFNWNLYREWGTKINYRAVDMAFNSTKEAMASSGSQPIFLSACVVIAFIAIGKLEISFVSDDRDDCGDDCGVVCFI